MRTRFAQLSTKTADSQTVLAEDLYNNFVYLATQNLHHPLPINTEDSIKGASLACFDSSGNCLWLSEIEDKTLESFQIVIPLKDGTVIAVAKMVKFSEPGTMPRFYAKLFALDEQGVVIQTHLLDDYHYVELTSGIAISDASFIVFGETKDEAPQRESTFRGWQFHANKFGGPDPLRLQTTLNGSFGIIEKHLDSYVSAGVGFQDNADTYSPVVRKISASGEIEWEMFARKSGSHELVSSLAVDKAGNIYIGSGTKVGSNHYLYVYKLDRQGKKLWQSKQAVSRFGKPGVSLLLEDNRCRAFSVQYGDPMNIHIHCFHCEDGRLLDTGQTGPVNTINKPLLSHEKSALLLAGNESDEEENQNVWVDFIPLEEL